ncbi:hypothetical protein [Streptococcus parauberis]|uniref:hypothetical protein n=1 Tax=Streptococcus parauberis TaxID=1348 RepID=UPI0037B50F1C
MFGDYTIMDLVSLGVILSCASVLYASYRDNKLMKEKFSGLSKEHDILFDKLLDLTEKHCKSLMTNQNVLSTSIDTKNEMLVEKNASVKEDTSYIHDEMLKEKMARLNLYQNISNASEVLKTVDIMRETILHNAKLEQTNQQLFSKVNSLEKEVTDLSEQPKNEEISKLRSSIDGFQRRLAEFEGYPESEEIQYVLRRILNELEE